MNLRTTAMLALVALLGACAQTGPQPRPMIPEPPAEVEPPPGPAIDAMSDVPGDRPLPEPQGALQRIDCMTGGENLHARIAFEAHGGQVTYFAYYSIWKPRTCSLDFERNAAGTKWRLTPDGSTRVQTPYGRFLIRTRVDTYVFEFEQVQRGRFCGMSGEINGSMTVRVGAGAPVCSALGIMNTNDEYLDRLYKSK